MQRYPQFHPQSRPQSLPQFRPQSLLQYAPQFASKFRIASFLFSWIAVQIAVLALCSTAVAAADETGYTFRSSASEVRIAFSAFDREGNRIKELHSSDIAVADNGSIIRKFRSFRTASDSTLDVVVLLDASDSVASQIPLEIAEAKSFVEGSSWGERDRVSILSFGGARPELLCARNCHEEDAKIKLNSLRASGATPLYDALVQATEILAENRDPETRSALILFSDGADTVSMHSLGDALQAAQNLQTAIYAVNTRPAKYGWGKGDQVMDYLAEGTGGLSFGCKQNVMAVLRTVLDDLHSGYVLTYQLPEQTRGQHSVRIVPTSNPRLQFRSRLAYDDSSYE